MGFKFGLEAVLKHRGRLEEAAQREFAEAQAAVDKCLREIEAMYQALDNTREDIAKAQASGAAHDLESIKGMEQFLLGQKIRIEMKREEARGLIMIAESKQEALLFAARERKVLSNLKERKRVQYQEHQRMLETKEQDDQTMVRQARLRAHRRG